MNIDYDDMATYFSMSARTLRRWKKNKPIKFNIMLEEYIASKEENKDSFNTKIMATAGFKGGTGKSTIAEALGSYLQETVIINVDFGQRAADINSCHTIDYVDIMKEKGLEELVKELSSTYRYIIIDTPGDITPEVQSAMDLASNIIIPMTLGRRSKETIKTTLEYFYGVDGTSIKDTNIYFFFNAYINKNKRKLSFEDFKEMYKELDFHKDINLKVKVGALDYSDTIVTSEESGKSIITLAQENRGAYAPAMKKISTLCSQIEEHFELD